MDFLRDKQDLADKWGDVVIRLHYRCMQQSTQRHLVRLVTTYRHWLSHMADTMWGVGDRLVGLWFNLVHVLQECDPTGYRSSAGREEGTAYDDWSQRDRWQSVSFALHNMWRYILSLVDAGHYTQRVSDSEWGDPQPSFVGHSIDRGPDRLSYWAAETVHIGGPSLYVWSPAQIAEVYPPRRVARTPREWDDSLPAPWIRSSYYLRWLRTVPTGTPWTPDLESQYTQDFEDEDRNGH